MTINGYKIESRVNQTGALLKEVNSGRRKISNGLVGS
jgi:hypothetical protein